MTGLTDPLFRVVDRIYVINLESRPDRRREVAEDLARAGISPDDPRVTFFKAVRPDAAGAFPSIGARGCFESHMGVLSAARDAGLRAILLLEDDARFVPTDLANMAAALAEIASQDWALAYPGHRIAPGAIPDAGQGAAHWRRLDPATRVETTHAMLIGAQLFDPLIAYFDAMRQRPAGDPAGGPMHVDGAYSWFRRAHPDLVTLVTPEPYVTQRASRSDIAPVTWKERVPLAGAIRRLFNRLK